MRDLSLRRRGVGGEDRLGALPDELLHLILARLDTRAALGTTVLSKRWAGLARDLPALDLKAADILPPRYHRCLRLRREASRSPSLCESSEPLDAVVARYQRRATRAMARSVKGLLAASRGRRRAKRLSLEVFASQTSGLGYFDRLVEEAIDSWGVEELQLLAQPAAQTQHREFAYCFPGVLISANPVGSRLRTLELSTCLPPSLRGFTALTTLVLRFLPSWTPAAAFERVVSECPQLQVLHLVLCRCAEKPRVEFDAPESDLRELLVEGGYFGIELRSLPKLERLTSVRSCVVLHRDAAPRLARVDLAFDMIELEGDVLSQLLRVRFKHLVSALTSFFHAAVGMDSLVLRFTGVEMWIAPVNPFPPMCNLRRLLVADVPSSWDATWPRLVVEAAPLLETLHVHFAPCKEETSAEGMEMLPWKQSALRHCCLKELVVIGFRGTARQVGLVRHVMEVSTALRRVALFKRGRVQEKGHCDWETVSQPCEWSEEEKRDVLEQITEGLCCSYVSS